FRAAKKRDGLVDLAALHEHLRSELILSGPAGDLHRAIELAAFGVQACGAQGDRGELVPRKRLDVLPAKELRERVCGEVFVARFLVELRGAIEALSPLGD